ncbi:MAG: bifunctional oligoribonuclease/PAP phosphatase NrnA [Bacilli bacterium]|nr:bifunctional oligoribonuclease/PAP phosphatase NrnA [Bacilli bacterium]
MDQKFFKELHNKFKYLEKKIAEYDRIVVYRHSSPDFDALGAQMGLVTWIKDNFPQKEVHYVGDRHTTFMPDLFPEPEQVSEEWYRQPHLAITVDVSNLPRVACEHLSFAKEVIKIDHHPLPREEEKFGDYLIVYPERPAAAELIALFALSRSKKFKFSKEAATYCYTGIVGDTGRFMYQDTDGATLRISADLLDLGIDKTKIYDLMYETDIRRMNILRYCLNNYKVTDKGTCYFVFDKETIKELDMNENEGNLHINQFRNLKGVRVVASITWKEEKQEYRVSLRSSHLHVAPVARQFAGGGHDFAAGCRLLTLDELPSLIQALDELPDNVED